MRHIDMDLIGVPVFVIDVDPDGTMRTAAINKADEIALGVRAQDVVGRTVGECAPPTIVEHLLTRLSECVEKRALHEYDEHFGSAENGRWWRTNLTPVIDPASGHVVRIVGISVEITERKAVEGLLSDAAFRDPLTGLANRRSFERDVRAAIESAASSGRAFGLAVIDLDGFKSINDTHGHCRGDDVLRHVASLMKLTAKAEESLARLGGDEFSLKLDATTPTELRKRVSDISRFLNRNLTVADRTVRVGASIGCALWHGEQSFEALFESADADMYRNKVARKASAASRDERLTTPVRRLYAQA